MANRVKKSSGKNETKAMTNVRRLAPLADSSDPGLEYLQLLKPVRNQTDIVLKPLLRDLFSDILVEMQQGEELRRHGLPLRSKVILCGPSGCGKTLFAEVLARELSLPLYLVKIDSVISSYLGETASNISKIFEFANRVPCVLFLDEFDALGRTRTDTRENGELRRVVNSLLTIMDQYRGRGMVIAATNLQGSLDDAIWRRFDEALEFSMPGDDEILDLMKLKFKNFRISFKLDSHLHKMSKFSYADVERVCFESIKLCILEKKKSVLLKHFSSALKNELRRRKFRKKSLSDC